MTPTEPDDTLIAEMVLLRASLQVARRRELLFRLFVLVVILAGVYSVVGVKNSNDAIVATRSESRAATCRSDNTFIENHNVLVDAVEEAAALVAAPNSMRTAEQQEAADRFVAEYKAKVERARVALRDCSPEAIKAFYEGGKS